MTKILVPSKGPESWKALLADPDRHWATGYSARTLAHRWEAAAGFPREVARVLAQSAALAGAKPMLILPEWQVVMPGKGRASQNDIWVLAKCDSGLVSIAVEGKVNEPFASTVGEWLVDASDGKRHRLKELTRLLGVSEPIANDIRYQLLHRTASAILEAQRFGATHAVMLVHSFSPQNLWLDDFAAFCALFGLHAGVDKLVTTTAGTGMTLHLGWVHGDPGYLEK